MIAAVNTRSLPVLTTEDAARIIHQLELSRKEWRAILVVTDDRELAVHQITELTELIGILRQWEGDR